MSDTNSTPTGPRRDATFRYLTAPASLSTWTPATPGWGDGAPSTMILGRPGMGKSACYGRVSAGKTRDSTGIAGKYVCDSGGIRGTDSDDSNGITDLMGGQS